MNSDEYAYASEAADAIDKLIRKGSPDFTAIECIVSRACEKAVKLETSQLQDTFDATWAANMRAIKRWQAATGRELTWPDHADLVIWLLERIEGAEAALHLDARAGDTSPSVNKALAALAPISGPPSDTAAEP